MSFKRPHGVEHAKGGQRSVPSQPSRISSAVPSKCASGLPGLEYWSRMCELGISLLRRLATPMCDSAMRGGGAGGAGRQVRNGGLCSRGKAFGKKKGGSATPCWSHRESQRQPRWACGQSRHPAHGERRPSPCSSARGRACEMRRGQRRGGISTCAPVLSRWYNTPSPA